MSTKEIVKLFKPKARLFTSSESQARKWLEQYPDMSIYLKGKRLRRQLPIVKNIIRPKSKK